MQRIDFWRMKHRTSSAGEPVSRDPARSSYLSETHYRKIAFCRSEGFDSWMTPHLHPITKKQSNSFIINRKCSIETFAGLYLHSQQCIDQKVDHCTFDFLETVYFKFLQSDLEFDHFSSKIKDFACLSSYFSDSCIICQRNYFVWSSSVEIICLYVELFNIARIRYIYINEVNHEKC